VIGDKGPLSDGKNMQVQLQTLKAGPFPWKFPRRATFEVVETEP